MFNPLTVILIVCLYVGFLFYIALRVEKKASAGINIGNNPVIYSLSLAVYCSAWTYYGSVGKAATSGMLFLTIYLGPTIAIVLWWSVMRKMVRIKNVYRITSIADFISARYHKSRSLAALATIVAVTGSTPYIALQIKAVISTFGIITAQNGAESNTSIDIGLIVVFLMILFTIIFGVRRLDPTERHQGMIVALAVECVVKLVAFLAGGIFVTYFLFGGFHDIFRQLPNNPFFTATGTGESGPAFYLTWTTYLVLAMSAIMFLPRQFHVAVIENFDEKHIRTAMWLFPLYMLLINLFVLPIAMGGLLKGFPIKDADTFVLGLPQHYGQQWLSLVVFIGGFSAATGMIMISSMTMATMITNHLFLPLLGWGKRLDFLKRYLLQCRWAAVAIFISMGYGFERLVGGSLMLVNMGIISFAAALQFAPSLLGGLFWKEGNKVGALSGLGAGFAIWAYTLILPEFVKSGWLSHSLLDDGPWGIAFLRPEHLFNITGMDPLSHAVFWTMVFNIGLYVLGSLSFGSNSEEQRLSEEFVSVLEYESMAPREIPREASISMAEKRIEIEKLLLQYFPDEKTEEIIEKCLKDLGLDGKSHIAIAELTELHNEIERILAGSIGASAAYHAIHEGIHYSPEEEKELSKTYAEILANLKLTPSELKEKIDYYRERAMLLARHAEELEEKIKELDREIAERKLAEEKRIASESKYQTLAESSLTGIYIHQDGKYVFVNKRFAEMHGYNPDELIGRPYLSVVHPDDRESVRTKAEKRIRGETIPQQYEIRRVRKDGQMIWVETIATLIQYEGRPAIMGNIIDITERKATEMLLKESEERYRLEFENINDIILSLDPAGRILSISPSVEKILGYAPEKIIGKSFQDLNILTPDSLQIALSNFVRVLSGENILSAVYEFIAKDGTRKSGEINSTPVYDHGVVIKVISVVRDISKRKHAEESLRASEEKYRTLVENVRIGVFRNTGGPNGRFIQANPAMLKIFGYDSLAGFMNINVSDLYQNPEDRKSFIAEISKNGFIKDKEFRMRKKDGTPIWASVTASVQYDEKGDIKWLDGVLEDVTERKHLEDQLRQAQKMEAVGTLAGGIAHDFNNILTAIITYGSFLKMKLRQDDPLMGYADEILSASNRAANLTQSLLTFSRKQKMNPRPINLNETLGNLEKLLLRIIGEDIELKTVMEDKEIKIMADPGQIEQVLMNLAANARDAMPNGGLLTIETCIRKFDADFVRRHGWERPGPYAVLSVTDTGMGMGEQIKLKIFEPFFTTKEVGKGTGLGLAMVYGIVKEHKGYINVYSALGKGTTFKIYLPVIETDIKEMTHESMPTFERGAETILLAEDNPEVRDSTVIMLEEFGYTVISAVDGEDAIEKFTGEKDVIDLVLIDVIMPKKNGVDAFEVMKKIKPDIKAIFMSGYTANIPDEIIVRADGKDIISKPFSTHELLKKVREVLDR